MSLAATAEGSWCTTWLAMVLKSWTILGRPLHAFMQGDRVERPFHPWGLLLSRRVSTCYAHDNVWVLQASMDIIQSAFNDQSVPYRNQIYGHIFQFMQAHVTIDWDKYKQVCNPQYCDIVEIKSVVDRLTEFLSTIGGLWNSLIGVAAVLWWVIDSLSCLGPGESSYRVWHNWQNRLAFSLCPAALGCCIKDFVWVLWGWFTFFQTHSFLDPDLAGKHGPTYSHDVLD